MLISEEIMSGIHFSAAELISELTTEVPFRTVLERGDVSALIYAPKEIDRQSAHAQAEIYVVVSGRGHMRIGWQDVAFAAGDLLCVDAGLEHCFKDFSADLAVWAVFFGSSIVGKHTFRRGAVSGDVTITGKVNMFAADWSNAVSGRLTGVGFARSGHIAFARSLGEGGSWPGLVEYRWEDDQLLARWTLPTALRGSIAGGRGTLLGGDGAGLAGRFQIQYQDATGADFGPPYELSIAGGGPTRTLEWRTSGATAFVGVGLVVDGALVAAWAPDGSGLEVVDYTLPNADGLAQMPGRYVRFGEHDAHDELVVLDAAT